LHQADGQQPRIQRAGVHNGHLLISLPDIEVTSPELPGMLPYSHNLLHAKIRGFISVSCCGSTVSSVSSCAISTT
jgi:hypothetical protein